MMCLETPTGVCKSVMISHHWPLVLKKSQIFRRGSTSRWWTWAIYSHSPPGFRLEKTVRHERRPSNRNHRHDRSDKPHSFLIRATKDFKCQLKSQPNLIGDQTNRPGWSKNPAYPSWQQGLVAKTDSRWPDSWIPRSPAIAFILFFYFLHWTKEKKVIATLNDKKFGSKIFRRWADFISRIHPIYRGRRSQFVSHSIPKKSVHDPKFSACHSIPFNL